MNILRFGLTFNALFSFVTGLTLALRSHATAEIFGVENAPAFMILGVSLIVFSIVVFSVSLQKPIRPLPAFVISVMDLFWVLGSAVLILLNPFDFTQTGNIIVGVVALMVLMAALMQGTGIWSVDKNPETGRKELHFNRPVNADAKTVWNLISDVANYHHVAPNIDDVKIISGRGEGMVRECSKGGGRWTEDCILWKEGEQFSFRVNTDAPDYPFPLRFLQGTWKVVPKGRNQSVIEMTFEFQYKKDILNLLLHPMMAPKFRSIVKELLENWEKELALEIK